MEGLQIFKPTNNFFVMGRKSKAANVSSRQFGSQNVTLSLKSELNYVEYQFQLIFVMSPQQNESKQY